MHSMCIAFLIINVVSNNFCMFCSQCFSFTVVVVIVFKRMAWVNSSCLLADVTCTYIFIRCTQSCCSLCAFLCSGGNPVAVEVLSLMASNSSCSLAATFSKTLTFKRSCKLCHQMS